MRTLSRASLALAFVVGSTVGVLSTIPVSANCPQWPHSDCKSATSGPDHSWPVLEVVVVNAHLLLLRP
jgi:hypothetical protein